MREPNMFESIFTQMMLNDALCYNGHSQLTVPKTLFNSDEVRAEFLDELQYLVQCHTHFTGFVACEIYSDMSGCFVAKDFWDAGEHHLNHRDKILLSFE